ncbi:MAG: hypothetical protein RLZZ501_2062 [Pseudomonadota bacterium]|jgi:putative PEP-CTERM system histidine kinase
MLDLTLPLLGALSPRLLGRIGIDLCVLFHLAACVPIWRGRAPRRERVGLGIACLATAVWAGQTLLPLGPAGLLALETLRATAFTLTLAAAAGLDGGIGRGRPDRLPPALAATALAGPALLLAGMALALPSWAWTLGLLLLILLDLAQLLLVELLLRDRRDRIAGADRLFCLTIGGLAAFDLVFFASLLTNGRIEPGFETARVWWVLLGAPLLAASALRRRQQRAFGLSRRVLFQSTVLISAGLYLVAVSLAGNSLRLWGGAWGGPFELAFLLVAMTVLAVALRSASLRARLNVLIGKHFFRLKYDYREVWLDFIGKMATPESEVSLPARALQAVAEAAHCRDGVLWTLQPAGEPYQTAATLGRPGEAPPLPADSALIAFLGQTGWVIDVAECRREPERYDGLVLPPWFDATPGLWVIVPVLHNRVLEGVMALGGAPSAPATLGWEEFDLLKTLGAQVAGYLAEERASRALLDTRRLAEFNQRVAFVAHDIKNVVAQMSLMIQNAERHGHDPDFQRDMVLGAADAVARLEGMLVQLGAESEEEPRPPAPAPVAFDLAAAVTMVARRWRMSFPRLGVIAPGGAVEVLGRPERLSTALDHLIQNAIDAAGPDGAVTLAVRGGEASGVVEVIDDGPGMKPDFVRDRLFRPLETSKPHGSGVGAFQALQTVREMNGRLEVESHPGAGTVMRIRLARPGAAADAPPLVEDWHARRHARRA